jgi:hypothetical protein
MTVTVTRGQQKAVISRLTSWRTFAVLPRSSENGQIGQGVDEEFWEITADFHDGVESEAREEARAVVAAGLRRRTFADELRDLSPGDVVTVVAVDGFPITGRILGVGEDVVRVGEVVDGLGTARRRLVRIHDVRIAAVVRLVREPLR